MNDAGGPAFPTCFASPHDFLDRAKLPLGMTLRDYFAAKTLVFCVVELGEVHHTGPDEWAAAAYEIADAMLKARNA